MSRSYEFVFGTRPWRIWHLAQLLLLLPLFWFADYFRHFVPGAGPQGGEAVFVLMLVYMLLFGVVAAVNALLAVIKTQGALLQRLLMWPALLLVTWLVAITLVLLGSDIGTAVDADEFDRWFAIAAVAAAILLFYGTNFAALRRARRG